MAGPASTPMMQQYLGLKEQYKDYLLFYRMGDFYEMFFEDAKIAAKTLDIALTKRGKEKDVDIPMCGVPFHSYEPYLERLIKAGFRVAICEQMESPEEAKKRGYKSVVKRDVVRVVTPGTLTEDNLLNPRESNYLLSIVLRKEKASLAWVDISTGKFFCESVAVKDLETKVALINPKELIVSDALLEQHDTKFLLAEYQNSLVNFPSSYFELKRNEDIIKDFYNVSHLDSFGNVEDLEIQSIGSLISYIKVTQKEQIPNLDFPKSDVNQEFLQIDKASLKSLEVFAGQHDNKASLLSLLDHTKTASGARGLRAMLSQPLLDIDKINKRLDKVSFFYNKPELLGELREYLKAFPDIERAIHKLLIGRGGPRDFLIIVNALKVIVALSVYFQDKDDLYKTCFTKIISKFTGFEELLGSVDIFGESPPMLTRDGNYIKIGISEQLDTYRNLKSSAKDKINALEEKYRSQTGVSNLKIRATNILGYYIEVNSNHISKLDKEFFIHRQTLASVTRFVTGELTDLQGNIASSDAKALELEQEIFNDLVKLLEKNLEQLKPAISSIALLDIYSNFAYVSKVNNFVRADIDDSCDFKVESGFHPVVKKFLPEDINEFIANDCDLAKNQSMWLITGPNMAGKSTYLRQNALLIILAQIGCYVPAKQAKIGVVDKIFSRVGAADDLSKGRSTFMVEMIETAAILNNATSKSFLILDEIGRGTATFDGLSLAWSIIEHIHDKIGSRTLFATHYHELSDLTKKLPNLVCYNSQVIEEGDKIIFSHKITPGHAGRSYGISVAALAGLPKGVLQRAKEVLTEIENKHKLQDSLQLSLFSGKPVANDSKDNKVSVRNDTEIKLFEKFKKLDIDNLSPKQALELLYDYKEDLK